MDTNGHGWKGICKKAKDAASRTWERERTLVGFLPRCQGKPKDIQFPTMCFPLQGRVAEKAVACILGVLLSCGCHAKKEIEMEIPCTKTVTFVNAVREGDAWILPRTTAILKTTLWGTPTVAKVQTGESRPAPLREPGNGGLYVFRMIDTDGFFHSADGLVLEDGWTVKIEGDGMQGVSIEVSDGNGVLQRTYEVFSARL